MKAFKELKSIAAVYARRNIDTDLIIPKQFLTTIVRSGLGKHLFFEARYDDDGNEIADFVLNKEPWRKAEILIASDNFGCGSSREHAPWALLDFGIKCVLAPSFADIFYNNCFKNGILPIALPEEIINQLQERCNKVPTAINVDLEHKTISVENDPPIPFDVPDQLREALLNGLDDIGRTLENRKNIENFEQSHLAGWRAIQAQ